MMKKHRLISVLLLLAIMTGLLAGCGAQQAADAVGSVLEAVEVVSDILAGDSSSDSPAPASTAQPTPEQETEQVSLDEDGYYYTKDEVALYIHIYGRLPGNFVSKKDAEKAGWKSGSLEKYLPGKVIGGSRFGNYEGLLPDKEGRVWTECDINTLGKSKRGAERIVFSNDGLIYYTGDHYEHFELLYGDPTK